MRTILIAALAGAALLPSAAVAQSGREVRNDAREVQHDREDMRRAERNGDYRKADAARQEMREDQREMRDDWRRYRESHRDRFRMGAYHGPDGYRYRAIDPGYRFERSYYGRRYWVGSPTRYHLPPAGRNQRWVRYGNDVVLVNIRTGRVIRVYRDFFW